MTELVLDNPFWRFSLAIYSTPGISAECLALQETIGIDVNLLLFCAWVGAEHQIKLTQTELDEFSATVHSWHEQVIVPLRRARQALKVIGGHAHLRDKVKMVELEGEQIEQAML
ncbi:MAG: TIGR02444 family protein, partial [Bryobacteraceae bacterium]